MKTDPLSTSEKPDDVDDLFEAIPEPPERFDPAPYKPRPPQPPGRKRRAKTQDGAIGKLGSQYNFYLYPEEAALLQDWVDSIPEAEGNRSIAIRIFLKRWDAERQARAVKERRRHA